MPYISFHVRQIVHRYTMIFHTLIARHRHYDQYRPWQRTDLLLSANAVGLINNGIHYDTVANRRLAERQSTSIIAS